MSITVTPTYVDIAQLAQQHTLLVKKAEVTGLTAAAANTIPHGLPHTPIAVVVLPYSNDGSASVVCPTLDGSNGTNGSTNLTDKLGFDATNVYVITPSAVTSCFLLLFY